MAFHSTPPHPALRATFPSRGRLSRVRCKLTTPNLRTGTKNGRTRSGAAILTCNLMDYLPACSALYFLMASVSLGRMAFTSPMMPRSAISKMGAVSSLLMAMMYKVNGWFPNYGCSSYTVSDGDNIVFCYTCNGLGADVGA